MIKNTILVAVVSKHERGKDGGARKENEWNKYYRHGGFFPSPKKRRPAVEKKHRRLTKKRVILSCTRFMRGKIDNGFFPIAAY